MNMYYYYKGKEFINIFKKFKSCTLVVPKDVSLPVSAVEICQNADLLNLNPWCWSRSWASGVPKFKSSEIKASCL